MTAQLLFTSLDALLRFAIQRRRLVECVYHGRRRICEPHDYGIHSGRERLLAYQLEASPDSTGERGDSGWRLFDVDKLQSWTALDRTFTGSRHQAHEQHMVWDAVYARVD